MTFRTQGVGGLRLWEFPPLPFVFCPTSHLFPTASVFGRLPHKAPLASLVFLPPLRVLSPGAPPPSLNPPRLHPSLIVFHEGRTNWKGFHSCLCSVDQPSICVRRFLFFLFRVIRFIWCPLPIFRLLFPPSAPFGGPLTYVFPPRGSSPPGVPVGFSRPISTTQRRCIPSSLLRLAFDRVIPPCRWFPPLLGCRSFLCIAPFCNLSLIFAFFSSQPERFGRQQNFMPPMVLFFAFYVPSCFFQSYKCLLDPSW